MQWRKAAFGEGKIIHLYLPDQGFLATDARPAEDNAGGKGREAKCHQRYTRPKRQPQGEASRKNYTGNQSQKVRQGHGSFLQANNLRLAPPFCKTCRITGP